jgi:hypothetical protein
MGVFWDVQMTKAVSSSWGRFTPVTDVSVPSVWCAGWVWTVLFKMHATMFLCRAPHGRHWYGTDAWLIRHWYVWIDLCASLYTYQTTGYCILEDNHFCACRHECFKSQKIHAVTVVCFRVKKH